jgi:hypothetical protein
MRKHVNISLYRLSKSKLFVMIVMITNVSHIDSDIVLVPCTAFLTFWAFESFANSLDLSISNHLCMFAYDSSSLLCHWTVIYISDSFL